MPLNIASLVVMQVAFDVSYKIIIILKIIIIKINILQLATPLSVRVYYTRNPNLYD